MKTLRLVLNETRFVRPSNALLSFYRSFLMPHGKTFLLLASGLILFCSIGSRKKEEREEMCVSWSILFWHVVWWEKNFWRRILTDEQKERSILPDPLLSACSSIHLSSGLRDSPLLPVDCRTESEKMRSIFPVASLAIHDRWLEVSGAKELRFEFRVTRVFIAERLNKFYGLLFAS